MTIAQPLGETSTVQPLSTALDEYIDAGDRRRLREERSKRAYAAKIAAAEDAAIDAVRRYIAVHDGVALDGNRATISVELNRRETRRPMFPAFKHKWLFTIYLELHNQPAWHEMDVIPPKWWREWPLGETYEPRPARVRLLRLGVYDPDSGETEISNAGYGPARWSSRRPRLSNDDRPHYKGNSLVEAIAHALLLEPAQGRHKQSV